MGLLLEWIRKFQISATSSQFDTNNKQRAISTDEWTKCNAIKISHHHIVDQRFGLVKTPAFCDSQRDARHEIRVHNAGVYAAIVPFVLIGLKIPSEERVEIRSSHNWPADFADDSQ